MTEYVIRRTPNIVELKSFKTLALLRNGSEAERCQYSNYTRIGNDKLDEYKTRKNWKALSKFALKKFIKTAVEEKEIFAAIVVDGIRYNFCYIDKDNDGRFIIHYELKIKK